MSETRRRWPKILLTVAVILAVLVVGGGILSHYLEKQQWIVQTVDTRAMADARKLDGLGRISVASLVPKKITQDKCTLYDAILYPSVRTVVCTVEIPKEFQEFAAYLIAQDGTVYPGWYNPVSAGESSTVKFNIAKVAFEDLSTDQLVRLDIVDQTEVSGTYTPDSAAARIIFPLTPPDKPAESEPAEDGETKTE